MINEVITHKAIVKYSDMDEWYNKTEQSQWNCFADVNKQTFEYEAIMTRVNELVEIVDDDTPQTDKNYVELDFLADWVVDYEKEHFSIGKS